MVYYRIFRIFNGFFFFRNKLKEKVADWGGGLGGSGFACRLCEFVTLTKDSLVTHAGYKHALFVQFMPENIQKDFLEVAKSCGENTESWDLGNNGNETSR